MRLSQRNHQRLEWAGKWGVYASAGFLGAVILIGSVGLFTLWLMGPL
jgi:hypothetical protein